MNDTHIYSGSTWHRRMIEMHRAPFVSEFTHGGDRVIEDEAESHYRAERRTLKRQSTLYRFGLADIVLLRERDHHVYSRELTDLGLQALESVNQGLAWHLAEHCVCMSTSRARWFYTIGLPSIDREEIAYLQRSEVPELQEARRLLTYELLQRTPTETAWLRQPQVA